MPFKLKRYALNTFHHNKAHTAPHVCVVTGGGMSGNGLEGGASLLNAGCSPFL